MENPLNSDALIIGNCLNCQGLVRVPSKASANSKVRCPHCTKSFLLSQVLDQSVPELELVDDPNAEVVDEISDDPPSVRKDEKGRFVVPSQLRRGSKKRRSRNKKRSSDRESVSIRQSDDTHRPANDNPDTGQLEAPPNSDPQSGVNEFSISETESPPRSGHRNRSGHSKRGGGSSRQKPSRRPRQPNSRISYASNTSGMEALKIALGGVLAIPVAYLVVLWVFKQDPLHVAPKISESVPFVVPAKFRTGDSQTDSKKSDEQANSNSDQEKHSGGESKRGESQAINDLEDLPTLKINPPNDKNT